MTAIAAREACPTDSPHPTVSALLQRPASPQDSEDDFEFSQEMEDHLQGLHDCNRGSILWPCVGAPAPRLPAAGGLEFPRELEIDGNEDRSSSPIAKRAATHGTWNTPTSTLEAASVISSVWFVPGEEECLGLNHLPTEELELLGLLSQSEL
ncbi:hypothetical protein ACQ4PT_037060 [Festuca glaucescens]